MKYNHAMAEREYKREWKAAKLEMRKAGMQRKQIRCKCQLKIRSDGN